MEAPKQTPKEDLRKYALEHYDKAASSIHHYSSELPKAVNFYYDYKDSFWIKIAKFLNK